MKCYRNNTTCAQYNLAFEERIFNAYNGGEDFFMLWRNKSAVIVGQNQVIENEVDVPYAEANGIQIVRRITGGGAVYHDLGNVNYTYISRNVEKFGNFLEFALPMIEFLRSLGVEAKHIGNNDIGIENSSGVRKISGGAQAVCGEFILHHGTLLFDTDLSILERVLTPDPAKLSSKGIKSVRSRVCNISEYVSEYVNMTRDEFWESICGYFNTDGIENYTAIH
ncbi:MAG: lipoate--protein ligase family protein [Planctomycetaceae bacterium]|nr:lipoate--protein ligase family protein [Planctomycetaceae bacterium]